MEGEGAAAGKCHRRRRRRNVQWKKGGAQRGNRNAICVPLVPYNTNSFLMQEHMPENDSAADRRDGEEFLTKEFSAVYETAKYERLESLTKPQLIEEYLKLESRYDQLLNQRLKSSARREIPKQPQDLPERSVATTSMDSESDSDSSSSSISSRSSIGTCSSRENSVGVANPCPADQLPAAVEAVLPQNNTNSEPRHRRQRHRTHRQRRNSRMLHQEEGNSAVH